MHATSRELDEEQDVEALEEECVDREEVALENARRLRPQELAPARLEPVRRRLDWRLLKDRPDGARSELDPEPTSSPWIRRYPSRGSSARAERQAHESPPASRAVQDAGVGTSSGGRPAPDASAAPSPVSPGTTSSTLAEAARD